jgi:hypothetical protein
MKGIPPGAVAAILEADPSSNEDESRQILKAYFDRAHQIVLGPYPGTTSGPDIIDRHRLIGFLELTVTLLRGIGAGEQLFNKLMIFSAALRDLDRGVTSPILAVRDVSKPPLGSEIHRWRAMFAVALDYLMKAGDKSDEAAKKLARIPRITRVLSGSAKAKTKERSAHTSIKKWRATLHRGEVPDKTARLVWKTSRENLAGIDGPHGFRAEADRLIKTLRRELVQ